jgi:hypothetical protein
MPFYQRRKRRDLPVAADSPGRHRRPGRHHSTAAAWPPAQQPAEKELPYSAKDRDRLQAAIELGDRYGSTWVVAALSDCWRAWRREGGGYPVAALTPEQLEERIKEFDRLIEQDRIVRCYMPDVPQTAPPARQFGRALAEPADDAAPASAASPPVPKGRPPRGGSS